MGHDEPEAIEPVEDKNPGGAEGEESGSAFEVSGEEGGEGDEELSEEEEQGDGGPGVDIGGDGGSAAEAVEGDFFGDAGVPDEHVLREGDVAPEEDEGEEEFSEVVVVFGCDAAKEVSAAVESEGDEDDGGEAGECGAGEVIDAIDGAGPAGVEGHEQVPRGEGEGECEDDHGRWTEEFHASGEDGIGGGVLFGGGVPVPEGEGGPDGEVEDDSEGEEARVEPGAFFEGEVVEIVRRAGPGVEGSFVGEDSEEDGECEDGEYGEGGGEEFGDAADVDGPASLGEVLEEDEEEGAESDAEEEGEVGEVSEGETAEGVVGEVAEEEAEEE